MKHLLHHFRRDRSYDSRDRWGVFAALAVLTMLVSVGSWLFVDHKSASATTAVLASVEVDSQDPVPADGRSAHQATITILDKATAEPKAGVWVGLKVDKPGLATSSATYLGWYSPEPGRAFYKTNEQGQVEFKLVSETAGDIDYDIYLADPKSNAQDKYERLEGTITASFSRV